jgi:predicted negative regulator of RcsB-dependent stress response
VDVYRTEDEQIEAIKSWWRNNGNAVFLGIALAIAGVLGWYYWTQHTKEKGESASVVYSELLVAMGKSDAAYAGNRQDEQEALNVTHLADKLKTEYSGTSYSLFSALMLAKEAVQAGKPDQAEKELRWALDTGPDKAIRLIIVQRLARVLEINKDYPGALSVLGSVEPGAQAGIFEDIRGDIYLAQGDKAKAREAYGNSIAAMGGGKAPALVKMKYDSLATESDN